MGIVNWIEGPVDTTAITVKPEIMWRVLQMDPTDLSKRWQGRLLIDPEAADTRRVIVELRKQFYRSEMVIELYDRQIKIGNEWKYINVNIESHVAGLTEDEVKEMNFAIEEGLEIYRHPAHWVELNKVLGNTEVLFP